VGPIGAHFRGDARFVERDESPRTAVITATGKDARGQASASAEIRAALFSLDQRRTRVSVETDLTITGRMAQFGRGAISDVSSRLVNQFTENLHAEVIAGQGLPAGGAEGAPAPGTPGALDARQLVAFIGPMLAKRVAPPLGLVLVALCLVRRARA
jgi:hypothetical protein